MQRTGLSRNDAICRSLLAGDSERRIACKQVPTSITRASVIHRITLPQWTSGIMRRAGFFA